MPIGRAGLLILLAAQLGWAQTLKLTSGGNASLGGSSSGAVTAQSPADAALGTVVNFGDVGPANPSSYVCLTQPLFLRAQVPSSLKAAVTTESFGLGPGDLKKSDIGIGFRNLAAGGANADISTTVVTPAYASDPCAAPKDPNGIPSYSATLSNLATAAPGTTVLQSTGVISPRGSFASASNRVLVDLRLAIAPQAFTAGSFSTAITLTITNP